MIDLWYKNAVVYCLDVETFMDADGDGIGDFPGLMERLEYIEGLGVNTIWLNPFYPSPNRDNGYDITDFYGVDTRHGSPGDFVVFLRSARDRGIKVLVDLVANHTSIDHPWFRSARSSPSSRYRDWYVWSEKKPDDIAKGIIFPGVQEAVWTYDRSARAWYLHRFYAHQADLNIGNPEVREEILKIMGFWLELGVSGFRVDAVPFLVEYKGLKEAPDCDPLRLLAEMRDFLEWRRAGAILLAEANVPRERAPEYFGGRQFGVEDRMHMLFDFPLNQHLWLSMARKHPGPLTEALRSRPSDMPLHAQWATFLRNHDELSLDRLTAAERQECFEAFAPDPAMRLYDRGIRRRVAPMLGGDDRRILLMQSLLFGLPGTPVMWYGDELGMGENPDLEERWPVRTPMPWSADEPGAGFSLARGDLVVPLAEGGALGFRTVNVADQEAQPGSLLSCVRGIIRRRRRSPEIGWGDWTLVEGLPEAVFGIDYRHQGRRLLVLANFSDLAVEIARGDLPFPDGGVELCADGTSAGNGRPGPVTLGPYGYLWLRAPPRGSAGR